MKAFTDFLFFMKLKLSSVDRIASTIIKQEDIDGYSIVKYILYFTQCFLLSYYDVDCIPVKFKISKGSIIIDRKLPIDLDAEPIRQDCLTSYVIRCVCKNLKDLKADEINKMITVIGSPYHIVISQGKTKIKKKIIKEYFNNFYNILPKYGVMEDRITMTFNILKLLANIESKPIHHS